MPNQPEINAIVRQLQKDVSETSARVEEVEHRLYKYDLLSAKWGGMCLFAVALGSWFFEYSDKIKTFLVSK